MANAQNAEIAAYKQPTQPIGNAGSSSYVAQATETMDLEEPKLSSSASMDERLYWNSDDEFSDTYYTSSDMGRREYERIIAERRAASAKSANDYDELHQEKMYSKSTPNSTEIAKLPTSANIRPENIDFSRIAKSPDNALKKIFFDKSQIAEAYWGDNGQLNYKILENGVVEIYENNTLMGYTDKDGLLNLTTETKDVQNTDQNIPNNTSTTSTTDDNTTTTETKPKDNPKNTKDETKETATTNLPETANISRENIDFSRIAKSPDNALSKVFFDKSQIAEIYWGDNGQLNYKVLDNGVIEIYENNNLMGYTDKNGLINLNTKIEDNQTNKSDNTTITKTDPQNSIKDEKKETNNNTTTTDTTATNTTSKEIPAPGANGELSSTLYYDTSLGRLCYGVYVPSNYDPSKKTALVMYIPGDGENKYYGAADGAQCTPNPFQVWTQTDNVIACAIQPGGADATKDYKQLIEMTELMKKTYNIDDSRIYLCAASKGGGAASMALASRPDIWAGYLQVASSMDRYGAPEVCAQNNIYTHVLIGSNDEVFTNSIKGNETALKKAYGDKYDEYVTYEVIQNKNHGNIAACATTDMVNDMLRKSKS